MDATPEYAEAVAVVFSLNAVRNSRKQAIVYKRLGELEKRCYLQRVR